MNTFEKELQKSKIQVDKKVVELTQAQQKHDSVIVKVSNAIESLKQTKDSTLAKLKQEYEEKMKATEESIESQISETKAILAKFTN